MYTVESVIRPRVKWAGGTLGATAWGQRRLGMASLNGVELEEAHFAQHRTSQLKRRL